MPSTLRRGRVSDPVESLDSLRPTQAKAGLNRTAVPPVGRDQTDRSDAVGSPDALGLTAVVKAAVLKHYGSVKAAAISLNVDASLMTREFDAGKFARLEHADAETKAAIADALQQAFGSADPKAKALRAIRSMRQSLDDLTEVL